MVGRGRRRGEEGVTLGPWVWAFCCPGCVRLLVLWWDRFPGPVDRKSFVTSAYDLGLGIELGEGGLVLVAGWGGFPPFFSFSFLSAVCNWHMSRRLMVCALVVLPHKQHQLQMVAPCTS